MGQEFPAERMQTNAAWAQGFTLLEAPGGQPLDLAGWTIEGVVQILGRAGTALPLSAANGRLVLSGAAQGQIAIALSAADCAVLGEGLAEIEIMRTAPAPVRPLIIASIENHRGLGA